MLADKFFVTSAGITVTVGQHLVKEQKYLGNRKDIYFHVLG